MLQGVKILSIPQANETYFNCLANGTPMPLHPTGVEGVWVCGHVEDPPTSPAPSPRHQQPVDGDCDDGTMCGHSGTPTMRTAPPRPRERVEGDFEGVCGYTGMATLPIPASPPRP